MQSASEPHPRPRAIARHVWITAILLVAAHMVLAWNARAPGILSDQAVYVSLGRALRELHYRELFRIDLPVHTMYPPGYPLLLAAWSAVGGWNFDWLVLLGISGTAAALLLFFSAVHAREGAAVALACLGALAFNPSIANAGGWVLSEGPFMMWQTLALWAVARGDDEPDRAVVAGAASIAAALTRSAGVTLVVALALYWLWKRRYQRVLVYGVIAAVTVGGWLALTAGAAEQAVGSSYVADALARPAGAGVLEELVTRITGKLRYLRHLYGVLPMPPVQGPIDKVIGGVCVAAFGLAGLFAWPRWWSAAMVYVLVYMALLMIWPWTVARFLVPILPWIVLTVILGAERLSARVRPRWRTATVFGVAGVLAVTGLVEIGSTINDRQRCDRRSELPSAACLTDNWKGFFTGVQYIRGAVAPGAIFVSAVPATLHHYTGHRVVSVTEVLRQSPSDFLPFLADRSATHILLSMVDLPSPSLTARMSANCHRLHLEASFSPTAYLFRLPLPGESPAVGPACQAIEEFLQTNMIRERRYSK